jgi:hypothetical protein
MKIPFEIPCELCLIKTCCSTPCKDAFDTRNRLINCLTDSYEKYFILETSEEYGQRMVFRQDTPKEIINYFEDLSNNIRSLDAKFCGEGWVRYLTENKL